MKRSHVLAAALVGCLVIPAAHAAPVDLTLRTPVWARAGAGRPVSFAVTAGDQDFVALAIRTVSAPAVARAFDSSGALVRGAPIDMLGSFAFVAPAAGRYRIDITAEGDTDCHVLWKRNVPLAERLRTRVRPAAIGGPRIGALRRALAQGETAALAAFWADVQTRGSPLVEPIPGDGAHMLVTFVWRATPRTRKVLLLWPALDRTEPEACSFTHLGRTDVWFATLKVGSAKRAFYRLVENGPDLPKGPNQEGSPEMDMIWAMSQLDPLNPRPVEHVANRFDPPAFLGDSTLEMPGAPAEPLVTCAPGVPRGERRSLAVESRFARGPHRITVWLPPGFHASGAPYGALYLLVGDDYIERMRVDAILDNLLAQHRIPPLVAVLVNNAPGLRNDMAQPGFSDFLANELAPVIRRQFNVSADPRRILIGGKSLGGLGSAMAAYWHPEAFGNVLSQSAGPAVIVERQFADTGRLPVRFFMSAGLDESGRGGLLQMNRSLHKALVDAGYDVTYEEIDGDHDLFDWRTSLPDGILALTRP